MKQLLLLLLCVVSLYSKTLNYYSIGKLSSPAVSQKITERFKAAGEPLFLIHDSKRGIAVGDFIKFKDKIVIIDGHVWQTLVAENAFANMKKIAVTTLNGGSSSSDWTKKSKMVKTDYSRKSYTLGAEILKIFEEQFSSLPRNESVVINFTRGRATLVVPHSLINSLKLQKVAKSNNNGKMVWTSEPCDYAYNSQEYLWQVWAADPAEPSGSIRYSLSGALPTGVTWNSKNHALEGTPADSGTFPLNIVARSGNKKISMACTLSVVDNFSPVWANAPDTLTVFEKKKKFNILLSDVETPSRDLTVSFDSLPEGFSYEDSTHTLSWIPADTITLDNTTINLTVTDPMNGVGTYVVPVYFEPDGVDVGYTFASLTPPWDTLVQGVTYNWNLTSEKQHWRHNHLEMKLGSVTDSTTLTDSVLIMHPKNDSAFHVTFRFRDRDKDITEYTMNLPVIPNRAPYFEAFPDRWDVEIRDLVYFTPKATDPEGEKVDLRLRSADSGFVFHDDGQLSFSATTPGTFQAFLEAEDEFGNVSVQQVSYYVKKVYDKYRGFKIESGVWPGEGTGWNRNSWGFVNPWRLNWDTPAMRFGIFSPDDANLFSAGDFHIPFFYVGTELVPPQKRSEGKSVVVDLGFSYNITTREIHTFGIYFNCEARAPIKELFNSELDVRFIFFARHLLRKVSVNHTINDDGSLDYEAVKSVELLEAFVSPTNLNLMLGGTQWFHLGYGLFFGPTFQTRIAPVAMGIDIEEDILEEDSLVVTMDQSKNIFSGMVGAGFRHHLKVKNFQLENRLRLGYGGEQYGAMLYWDCVLGFGRFKR